MMQVGDKWNQDGLNGPPVRFTDRGTGHGVKLALERQALVGGP
jgi:hypothetical protein